MPCPPSPPLVPLMLAAFFAGLSFGGTVLFVALALLTKPRRRPPE